MFSIGLLGASGSDSGGGVACGLVALGGLVVFFLWFQQFRNQDRAQMFSSLAARWDGRVDPGGTFAPPRLHIRVDGIDGEVTYFTGGKHESPWTKARFAWGSPRRLRIAPEGFASWLRRTLGGGDLTVGDRGFDELFWIESTDPVWARELLSNSIRRGLMMLQRDTSWFSRNHVTLDLGPAGVSVKVARLLVDDRARLENFIELAVLILRAARGTGDVAGVVLVSVEAPKGSVCLVCGHAVDGGKTCPECRTPHHDDCWRYSGGCARFGCRGRRPKAA